MSALARSTEASSPPWRSLLYCCRRRHNSLYRRNNLGYSPSKACFRKDEAGERKRVKNKKKRYSAVLGIAAHWAHCKKQNTCLSDYLVQMTSSVRLWWVRERHHSNCPGGNPLYRLLRWNYLRTWTSFVQSMENKIAVPNVDEIPLFSHTTYNWQTFGVYVGSSRKSLPQDTQVYLKLVIF